MKRLCVAVYLYGTRDYFSHILMGRRNKDPNRGMLVFHGGHVEENESLEDALRREIREETGLEIFDQVNLGHQFPTRFSQPFLIELEDRIILIVTAQAKTNNFKAGDDLIDLQWMDPYKAFPRDVSPVIAPAILRPGWKIEA